MSAHQSKTFFKNLKDTCRKIEHDVNEVKKKLYEIPENGDLASKKISEIQDKIKTIKTEAENVLRTLKPRLAHYHDFIQHFTELTSETEVMISKQESFLQQYGYQPLELASESELQPVENDVASPVKASEENESFCATPNFLDYGIVPRNINSGPTLELKERKSSFEDLKIPTKPNVSDSVKSQAKDSDSTPTLEIIITADTAKETPPIPESPAIHVSASPSTPTLVL